MNGKRKTGIDVHTDAYRSCIIITKLAGPMSLPYNQRASYSSPVGKRKTPFTTSIPGLRVVFGPPKRKKNEIVHQAYLLRFTIPRFNCQVPSSLYDTYKPQKKHASPRQSTLFNPSLSSYPGSAGVTRTLW